MRNISLLNKMTVAIAGVATVGTVAFASVDMPANAATFVGSYAVYDGPLWPDNPPVYSAQEAAALIFGGSPTDYAISIFADSITNTAWYDGWGEHNGMIFAEDYKLDLGAPGYNDPAGEGTARSAYVRDGLFDTNKYRNYVFQVQAVPEPSSLGMTGAAIAVGLLMMKRKYKSSLSA
ncbi:PEP-CTERM sorting domain-containing protein [Anabaena sp. WFMT]|uniref:PEP-CTERM sorting domain-containing protein n=1 Tax=Anabaena sp. WFMT TaxID=3449730 RepID=UPI003F24708A